MKAIFVYAKTESLCRSVACALEELCCEVSCCWDPAEAAAADLCAYGTVIVSTPLQDEFGLNFIAELHRRTSAGIIVLAKTDIADEVQTRINFTGAFVLARPFTKAALVQSVRMAVLAKENMRRLQDENTKLTQKLDDYKMINRAKCCLIQYLNFTEEQAERHIRKLAMDSRRTAREVAEDTLRTYGGITGG